MGLGILHEVWDAYSWDKGEDDAAEYDASLRVVWCGECLPRF